MVFRHLAVALSTLLLIGTAFAAEPKDTVLTLELASRLAKSAFDCAAKKDWKLSVAIVNAEGNLILFQRGDGAYVGSIEAAIAKARSSNAFRRPTSAFTQAVKGGRIELLSVREIVAVEGGVPIQLAGQHAGALGISGARSVEDEECANAALTSLK